MNIRINNEHIDITFENEKNLGEILGILEAECEKSGSTITRICIDGDEIPADSLDAYFQRSPDSISEVELFVTSAQDILSLIHQSGKNFSSAAVRLKEVPVQLQTGKDLAVIETINFFSMEIQSLHKILPLLPLVLPGKEPYIIEGIPLVSFISEMTPFLQDFLDGLKTKDTILVGDIAEYEFAPRLEKLGAFLETI